VYQLIGSRDFSGELYKRDCRVEVRAGEHGVPAVWAIGGMMHVKSSANRVEIIGRTVKALEG